jgi:hypothetical protein
MKRERETEGKRQGEDTGGGRYRGGEETGGGRQRGNIEGETIGCHVLPVSICVS